MSSNQGTTNVVGYAGAMLVAGALFLLLATPPSKAMQANANVHNAGAAQTNSVKPAANTRAIATGQARPRPSPTPQPAQAKQAGATGASKQTGGSVTTGNQIKQQTGGPMISAGIPNIAADLSASQYSSGEFVAYEKKQSTSTSLYFKLITAASAQKIVWQVSSAPFAKPKDGLDWKAPAGLLASGEAKPGQSATVFSIDFQKFLGMATEKSRFVYVRAVAINTGVLAARPSNDVIIGFGSGSSKVNFPDQAKTPPAGANFSAVVVLYKPPIRPSSFSGCRFILTKTPPEGELKYILAKINATTPGTRFMMCPADYNELKKMLSAKEWVVVAFKDFLNAIKSGYNWLDDKYNYLENQLVAGLDSIGIPPSVGRNIINYYKMVYGLNMSYGNFDESLDHGKTAFAAHLMASGDVSDKEKPNIIAKFNQFGEEVRKQANGGGDPSRFYRADPDFVPRPAYVVVRVKCQGTGGATCKKSSVTVKFDTTADDASTLSSVHPQVRLFEAKVEVPQAKAGDTFDIPVYLKDTPLYKSDQTTWLAGYHNQKPGKLAADSNVVQTVAYEKYPK